MKILKSVAVTSLIIIGLGSFSMAMSTFDAAHPKTMELRHLALGYGEISPRTGRPATNHVNGYFRSNGTYVNGYWRS